VSNFVTTPAITASPVVMTPNAVVIVMAPNASSTVTSTGISALRNSAMPRSVLMGRRPRSTSGEERKVARRTPTTGARPLACIRQDGAARGRLWQRVSADRVSRTVTEHRAAVALLRLVTASVTRAIHREPGQARNSRSMKWASAMPSVRARRGAGLVLGTQGRRSTGPEIIHRPARCRRSEGVEQRARHSALGGAWPSRISA